MSRHAAPPYGRVMSKVERHGACLVFTGRLSRSGYGRTSVQVGGRTKELWPTASSTSTTTVRSLLASSSCTHATPGHASRSRTCASEPRRRTRATWSPAREGARASTGYVCARGHDLELPGAVAERRPRSQNPAKPGGQRRVECQREYGRASRVRHGYGYTGQPANRDKTRCKRGHEFTPENTRVLTSGGRACRECARVAARARRLEELRTRAAREELVAGGRHLLTMTRALATARGDAEVASDVTLWDVVRTYDANPSLHWA